MLSLRRTGAPICSRGPKGWQRLFDEPIAARQLVTSEVVLEQAKALAEARAIGMMMMITRRPAKLVALRALRLT